MDYINHCIFIFMLIVSCIACFVVGIAMLTHNSPTESDTLKQTRLEQAWGLIGTATLLLLGTCYYIYYLVYKEPAEHRETQKNNASDLHQTLLTV
jgi:heme/copper-type cytochrome/quinol oxidase subunit 2